MKIKIFGKNSTIEPEIKLTNVIVKNKEDKVLKNVGEKNDSE